MKKKMLTALSFAAAMVLTFASCSSGTEDPGPVSVTRVTASEKTLNLYEGETSSFTVKISPSDAANQNFTVKSANSAIATAKKSGNKVLVTGIAEGETKITVTSQDGNKKAIVTVTVTKKVAVTDVTVSSSSITVNKGFSDSFTVTITPEDASNKEFLVTSSDAASEYVSYNVEGSTVTVTGLQATEENSDVTLTVTSADDTTKSATVNVKVTVTPALSLSKETVSLAPAGEETIEITPVNFDNFDSTSLNANSDNTNVVKAEIKDGKLVLTGVADGETTVTVSSGDVSASVSVKVFTYVAVSSVTVSGNTTVMATESIKLSAEVLPSEASNKDVTWTSSDESIATVDSEGNVTGVKAGSVTITATADGIKGTYKVTVTKYQAAPQDLPVLPAKTKIEGASIWIQIDASSMNATWGDTFEKLESGKDFTVSLSNGSDKISKTYLADPATASDGKVSSFVLFVNMQDGSVQTTNATVSITVNDVTYTGTVEFTNGKWIPSDYEVTGITVTPSGKSLRAGNTLQFAAADSTYGITQNVTWSCDTGTINTNGLYTAPASISEDTTATITATYSETVKGTVTVALVADSTEVEPFTVALSNEGGAWMKIDVYYNDAAYAINADNAKISDVKLSVDGSALSNVSWVASLTNGVRWARDFPSANLTNSGVTQDLTFTVEIATGEKYSFKVNFTGANNTEMTVNSTEYSLLKDIALSSTSETLENVNDTVDITVSGVGLTLDNSKISASSSAEGVATVALSGNTLTVTAVAEGDAVITVSYADEDVADKTVKIHVGEKQLLESYDFTNTTYYSGDNITTREASKVVLTSYSSDANNYTTQFKYMGLTLEPGSYVATVTLKSSVARKLDFFVQQNSTWTMITQSSPFDVEADTEITKTVDLTISNTTDNLMLCVMAGNVGTAVDSEVTITYLNIEEK